MSVYAIQCSRPWCGAWLPARGPKPILQPDCGQHVTRRPIGAACRGCGASIRGYRNLCDNCVADPITAARISRAGRQSRGTLT